jgi:hypothetical protein
LGTGALGAGNQRRVDLHHSPTGWLSLQKCAKCVYVCTSIYHTLTNERRNVLPRSLIRLRWRHDEPSISREQKRLTPDLTSRTLASCRTRNTPHGSSVRTTLTSLKCPYPSTSIILCREIVIHYATNGKSPVHIQLSSPARFIPSCRRYPHLTF